MSKEFEEIILKKLETIEIEVKDNKQLLRNLTTKVESINQRLGNLEIEVKDTGEVVKYLNQNFTKFDFEINNKIDTLFDSHIINKDDIVSLNKKTFNHDTRISKLENKDLKIMKF